MKTHFAGERSVNTTHARQCKLLGMSRAAYCYAPWEWDETALAMLRALDEE